MSVFGNLIGKIVGHYARVNEAKVNETRAANAPAAGVQEEANAAAAAAKVAGAAGGQVDVQAELAQMASESSQKLDWQNSIVDLMKLVGMDSSLSERKALAQELGYTGSTDDSATMNIWLHKEVMSKMAENGGKVPANMLD